MAKEKVDFCAMTTKEASATTKGLRWFGGSGGREADFSGVRLTDA
jgi:hypothetical protein